MGPAGRRVNKRLGSPIRPAKGVLSFLHKSSLVLSGVCFVPEPPVCSWGEGLGGGETSPNTFCPRTPGMRWAPTCFVPEPPLCIIAVWLDALRLGGVVFQRLHQNPHHIWCCARSGWWLCGSMGWFSKKLHQNSYPVYY